MSQKRKQLTQTYANQVHLPPLPVPDLNSTCEKYLRSLEPLLSKTELEQSRAAVREFLKEGGDGERLQAKLLQRKEERWKHGKNWLEEWWLRWAYLNWPDPIAINVNYYIVIEEEATLKPDQAFQAARMTTAILRFKNKLDTQQLPAESMLRKFPLDMNQYDQIFTTARIPGEHGDISSKCIPLPHMVVICKKQFYVVNLTHKNGETLSTHDIEIQIRRILDMSKKNPSPRNSVGIMTATNRPDWARCRNLMSQDVRNR